MHFFKLRLDVAIMLLIWELDIFEEEARHWKFKLGVGLGNLLLDLLT